MRVVTRLAAVSSVRRKPVRYKVRLLRGAGEGSMIDACGVTHPGRVRSVNEDAFLVDHELQMFVVADGMGGHNAGDRASRIAVETVRAFVARSRDQAECTWPYGIDGNLSLDANRLRTALMVANRKVFKAADDRDDYAGMGTTIVAALVGENDVCYGGVGDSRMYTCSGGAFSQVTQDDSWVATILAADPTMTKEEMASHPMRHMLTKVLGVTATIDLDVSERRLQDGDRFLLCSDGLHNAIDDAALEAILSTASNANEAADRLLQTALDGPAVDNVTALVLRYST
jgi:protein phosphatase